MEMRAALTRTEEFTSLHAAQLHPCQDAVDARLMRAVNEDFGDFVGELRDDAIKLRQAHAFVAPTNGAGPAVRVPRFSRLFALVDEDSPFNLVGRMDAALEFPWAAPGGKSGTSKRKAAASTGEPGPARTRTAVAGPCATSPFIPSMVDWQTPAGVCASTWKGRKCTRDQCVYDHSQQHACVPPPPASPPSPAQTGPRPNHIPRARRRRSRRQNFPHPPQPRSAHVYGPLL